MNQYRPLRAGVKNSRVCAPRPLRGKDIDVAAESLKVAEAFRIHTFIATSPMHIATKLRSTLDEVIERAIYMGKTRTQLYRRC